MEETYIVLGPGRVALASLLILINGAVSLALRLGMERTLLVASIRTVGQLLLIGIVLEWVFHDKPWYVVAALLVVMTLVAGITAVQRNSRRYAGIWLDTLFSVWASSWIITAFAMFVVIRDMQPWYQPQYVIPLLGMVLGNTLTGISLGLNALTESLVTRRDHVEGLLALGADPLGGGESSDASRDPHRHDADRKLHDGRRHRELAGNDDRPDSGSAASDGCRQIPDRDHVSGRFRNGPGNHVRNIARFPPALQQRSPVPVR